MSAKRTLRILTEEHIKQCMSMEEAIQVNRKAFQQYAEDKWNVPDRIIMDSDQNEPNGKTLVKPAYCANHGLGLKVVSVRPKNAEKSLPTVPGFVFLLDEETGLPSAMMDATYLTGLRTAAGSAVATDLFAKKEPNQILAVFGAGLQAKLHIEAMLCVRDISQILIVNRTPSNAEKLMKELSSITSTKMSISSPDEAIAQADLIVTCTNASTPLFDGSKIPTKRVHVNAVGSFTPTMQEIDEETIRRSLIILDSKKAMEAGDICIPLSKNILSSQQILGDLGSVLLNKPTQLPKDKNVTLFKSVGLAIQDIATGYAIDKIAQSKQIGHLVPL